MFVKLKIGADYSIGSALSYDTDTQKWALASNSSRAFGLLEESPTQDDDGNWWGIVRFGGTAAALTDRAIPVEGGFLDIENGCIHVSSTNQHCGIVAPAIDSSTRENKLVLVFIG